MMSKSRALSVCQALLWMMTLTSCSAIGRQVVTPSLTIAPSVEALGTPSPVEPPLDETAAGDVTSVDGRELTLYRGPNPYQSTPPFEIYYSPSEWEYVEDDESGRFHQLFHLDIDGCVFWLNSGGIGAQLVDTVNLGDIEWRIFQVSSQVLNYSVLWQNLAFIFGLTMPERYSRDEDSPCLDAAEEVIATFEVISEPLPYTVKGYELYSWYTEPEGEWYFKLISGTDRLKTYREVTSHSTAEDGWVNISVKGVQALKFLLDRIPDDTTVIWIGLDWLEDVQAEKELVETISLPGREVIEKIAAYSQQLGVELIIEEIR